MGHNVDYDEVLTTYAAGSRCVQAAATPDVGIAATQLLLDALTEQSEANLALEAAQQRVARARDVVRAADAKLRSIMGAIK